MPSPAPSPEYNQQRPLPTPRTLLTSLLNSLSTSPVSGTATTGPSSNAKSNFKSTSTSASLSNTTNPTPPSNPLKPLSTPQKSLLATLHVLFPPPTLLQALNLLDRGLVTHVYVSNIAPISPPRGAQESLHENMNLAKDPESGREIGMGDKNARANTLYQVRSAQSRSRYSTHSNPEAVGGLVYTVRLGAWSCDCAAFAFAAFPPEDAPHGGLDEDYWDGEEWGDDDGDGGEKKWEVGGLSFNGKGKIREAEGVPVCKHLLACFLAERWEEVFGGYVKEREVGREGGAGIGGA